jgi:hypothetical protein
LTVVAGRHVVTDIGKFRNALQFFLRKIRLYRLMNSTGDPGIEDPPRSDDLGNRPSKIVRKGTASPIVLM